MLGPFFGSVSTFEASSCAEANVSFSIPNHPFSHLAANFAP